MPTDQSRSFAITIRPSVGISPDLEKKLTKIFTNTKHQDGVHIVAEKSGVERHLHIQLWFSEEKRKGDIKKKIERVLDKYDWWDVNHKRHCIKIKMAYNDWVQIYCEENEEKNDEFSVIIAEIPSHTPQYYPSEKDQEKLLESYCAVDKKYYLLKEEFLKWQENQLLKCENQEDMENWRIITKRKVAEFLTDSMFLSKTQKVVADRRKKIELCDNLYYYIKPQNPTIKYDFLSNEEKKIWETEDQENLSLNYEKKNLSKVTIDENASVVWTDDDDPYHPNNLDDDISSGEEFDESLY